MSATPAPRTTKEPFDTFIKSTENGFGGAEATSFERMMIDLVQWFIDSPTPIWRNETRQVVAYSENNYRY